MAITIMTLMMIVTFGEGRRIDLIGTMSIDEQSSVRKRHVEHGYVLTQYLSSTVAMKMDEIRARK